MTHYNCEPFFPDDLEIEPIYNAPVTIYGLTILSEDTEPVSGLKGQTFPSELALIEEIEKRGYKLGEGTIPEHNERFNDIVDTYYVRAHSLLDENGMYVAGIDIVRGGQEVYQELRQRIKEINPKYE
jgi:hypothetical protein